MDRLFLKMLRVQIWILERKTPSKFKFAFYWVKLIQKLNNFEKRIRRTGKYGYS
jgi:hypothetical protein